VLEGTLVEAVGSVLEGTLVKAVGSMLEGTLVEAVGSVLEGTLVEAVGLVLEVKVVGSDVICECWLLVVVCIIPVVDKPNGIALLVLSKFDVTEEVIGFKTVPGFVETVSVLISPRFVDNDNTLGSVVVCCSGVVDMPLLT